MDIYNSSIFNLLNKLNPWSQWTRSGVVRHEINSGFSFVYSIKIPVRGLIAIDDNKRSYFASWIANAEPGKIAEGVRNFVRDLSPDYLSFQQRASYAVWIGDDCVHPEHCTLGQALEECLNPANPTFMDFFRIYTTPINLFVHRDSDATFSVTGFIAISPLPLDAIVSFYNATSGIEPQPHPRGIDRLEKAMQTYRVIKANS